MSSSCISVLDELELTGRKLALNSLVGLLRTLKVELMFLRTISIWVLSHPSEEFKHDARDLQEAYWSINDDIIQLYPTRGPQRDNLHIEVSRFLERLKHIKPDVKQVCHRHLEVIYSRSSWLCNSDNIKEFISDLQDNLKYLFRLKGADIIPVKKHMEVVEQKLIFLKDLTDFTEKHSKGDDERGDLMVHIRDVTDNLILVSYLYLVDEMDESMARKINLKLTVQLQKIKLINPEVRQIYIRAYKSWHLSDTPWRDLLEVVCLLDFIILDLKELLHYNTNFMGPMKVQIEILDAKVKFLKPIFVDLPTQHMPDELKYLMRNNKEVIRELGPIIHSFSAEDSENVDGEMNSVLLDLLESVKLTEEEFGKINLHKFPSTDELRSVDFILENMWELLVFKTDLNATSRDHIETLHKELLSLRSFLDFKHEEQKYMLRRVVMVAYRAEFVVDSIAVGGGPTGYDMLQLETILNEVKLIVNEVKLIKAKVGLENKAKTILRNIAMQETKSNFDEVVVGIEDEAETLKKLLIGDSKRRDIIVIVGIPGLGKTTLAKKLYNSPSFEQHFDVRVWCCVSRTYQIRDMLVDILSDLIEIPNKVDEMGNEELGELLYKNLKGKRYLFVMDDMWDIGAWNALKKSFPDDKKSSRVLITSRFHDVALQVTPGRNIHFLRLLSDEESLNLLKEKLFRKESIPEELSEAVKEIAKNCKGLPLGVVLVAGILSNMDKTKSQWQQLAQFLRSRIGSDPTNQCMAILELSYTHLPDHLKSCFLYFGAFPEKRDISVKKLTWLWNAEGFERNSNSESLERDLAENYLMDLICRGLVSGSKITSKNGVKACHIHDLVHEFCLEKAERENFLQCVRGYDNLSSLTQDDANSNFINSSSLVNYEQYRLSVYSKQKKFIMGMHMSPNLRSLFLHAFGGDDPVNATFISRCFKLLRILDMEFFNIGESFNGIELLVNLRFLAVRVDMASIPSSIANLWRLETFLLKRSRGESVQVPDSIWNMVRLRHFHINDTASFNLNQEILEKSPLLEKLETFSTPTLSYGDNAEKMMRKFPNLRKLRCIFLDAWDNDEKFPNLSFLSQLVSLKVSSSYPVSQSSHRFPCEFSFPSNLRKLTLSAFCLPWSEISSIGKLPNLEVLKLHRKAFEGTSWDMKEGEFTKLNHLKLESLDIGKWNATAKCIPCLVRLVLRNCEKLQEIPPSFADIPTLSTIEVRWCSSSATNSASNILEKETDRGNMGLKVHIYRKEKDSRASSKANTKTANDLDDPREDSDDSRASEDD